MKLFLERDFFDTPKVPEVYLCNTSRRILGELCVSDLNLKGKWNGYSEVQFNIQRNYVDVLTGESKVCALFDKVESPRNIYVKNVGYFTLQDLDSTYADKDEKQVTAFSLEYATANKFLENFYVNTGEIDSKEVIYEYNQYGEFATKDIMYKRAVEGKFDTDEKYFVRDYKSNGKYSDYIQVEIADENEYSSHFGEDVSDGDVLYIHGYANVKFYDPLTPELSLLHLIFDSIPEWKIGDVDYVLRNKERKISEDRISVYDILNTKVCDLFGCICEWDTINGVVNFYEELEDGLNDDRTANTKWDTDVYISRDNLASSLNVKYSSDDIKTKLKVTGGSDDLQISEINLGKNYLLNLTYYHDLEWMEQDLYDAYSAYLRAVETNKPKYNAEFQAWVAANKKYNELMNAVPAEGNIVLVGDEFKKLYCVYTPIDTAYTTVETIVVDTTVLTDLYSKKDCKEEDKIDKTRLNDKATYVVKGYQFVFNKANNTFKCTANLTMSTSLDALKQKLWLYQVDKDIVGNISDNILLKLKSPDGSQYVTIRLFAPKIAATSYIDGEKYYKKDGSKYTDAYIVSGSSLSGIFVNDYKIRMTFTDASGNIDKTTIDISINDWISGKITNKGADYNIEGYKIQSIGTMGAYFVLAKDETKEENIQDYGVNLLKSKQKEYMSIQQAQMQNLYSDEPNKCVMSDIIPSHPSSGDKWFCTANIKEGNTIKYKVSTFYKYENSKWNAMTGDTENYENYLRYTENFNKLQTVNKVLAEKEKMAQYMLNGYAVSNMIINNTTNLEANMKLAATYHFLGKQAYLNQEVKLGLVVDDLYADQYYKIVVDKDELQDGAKYYVREKTFVYRLSTKDFKCVENQFQITRVSIDEANKIYKFTYTGYPDATFAVYLSGATPYVSYADSCEIHNIIKNNISLSMELNNFFNDEQWIRLSPFIKEDEFNGSDFVLTGYETEEERLDIYEELIAEADKELTKLSSPSLEFSMDMANILALPEFASLISQFQLGNFIRIELRPGVIKKARLLEANIDFSDLSNLDCSFGSLVTAKTEVDKHAELLSQAITAGKQVATSGGNWQKAVDTVSKIEDEIYTGLKNTAIRIGQASGQAISWDETGMHFRKFKPNSTTEYEPEEMAIINNCLVATNDSWKTSKSAFGKYTVNGETKWGAIAEYITSNVIEGKAIRGGSMEIGGTGGSFIVNEDGSVEIKSSNGTEYINAMTQIDNAYRFSTTLSYSGLTIFTDTEHDCIVTCNVYDYKTDITAEVLQDVDTTFTWRRVSNNPTADESWKPTYINGNKNQIRIKVSDIDKNSQIYCDVDFNEKKFTEKEETNT